MFQVSVQIEMHQELQPNWFSKSVDEDAERWKKQNGVLFNKSAVCS